MSELTSDHLRELERLLEESSVQRRNEIYRGAAGYVAKNSGHIRRRDVEKVRGMFEEAFPGQPFPRIHDVIGGANSVSPFVKAVMVATIAAVAFLAYYVSALYAEVNREVARIRRELNAQYLEKDFAEIDADAETDMDFIDETAKKRGKIIQNLE